MKVWPRITQAILRNLIPFTAPRLPALCVADTSLHPFVYTENDRRTWASIPSVETYGIILETRTAIRSSIAEGVTKDDPGHTQEPNSVDRPKASCPLAS